MGVGKKARQFLRSAALLLVAAFLLVPSAASAQPSGGVGGRVANPDPNNARTKSIFIYTLERAESKQDQLLVINPTDEEQTVLLGSVDGVVTNTGAYTCRMEAEPVEDSGGWVQLSKTQVTIPAGGEELVDFTVTVPANADVGEHNSCLTLRAAGEDAEEVSGGVYLRTRQAIRMITTIPGDLTRDLSISQFAIKLGGVEQQYTMTVANGGNVSADVDMQVKLYNIFGQEVVIKGDDGNPINIGGEYPVVPGESLTQQFKSKFMPLFGGWYKVVPSIRYDERLGAFGTQSQDAEYETIEGESQMIFLWPTMLGWLILIGALTALILIIWRTTGQVKRQRRLRKSAVQYTVQKQDTIQSLAKKSKVSWQELAKLNNIKAPYSLEVGHKILLPAVQTSRRRRTTKKG